MHSPVGDNQRLLLSDSEARSLSSKTPERSRGAAAPPASHQPTNYRYRSTVQSTAVLSTHNEGTYVKFAGILPSPVHRFRTLNEQVREQREKTPQSVSRPVHHQICQPQTQSYSLSITSIPPQTSLSSSERGNIVTMYHSLQQHRQRFSNTPSNGISLTSTQPCILHLTYQKCCADSSSKTSTAQAS